MAGLLNIEHRFSREPSGFVTTSSSSILWLAGKDLGSLSLIERKSILRSVIPTACSRCCMSIISKTAGKRGGLKVFPQLPWFQSCISVIDYGL